MKILFLTDSFSPKSFGGAGIVAYNLAKGLEKEDHKVFVIATTQKKSEQGGIKLDNLDIFRIYSNYHPRWQAWLSLYNPQTVSKVANIIKEIRPDIVHAHNIHQYFSYHCLNIAKKYAGGVFLTAHDVMLFNYGKLMPKNGNNIYRVSAWDQIKGARKRYNPFRNIVIRHYLKYVDKIFAVSDSLKKVLEINGIKNIERIYNGINVSDWETDIEGIRKFKRKYSLQNKKIILFGGRLSGAKGRDIILRAMATITKKVKNAVLVVIGETDDFNRKMIDLVISDLRKEFDAKRHIIFTGWLNRDKLKAAYHSADILAFPSICFETFGMNNLEAMACKKPVVSTFFGGPKEVVVDPSEGGAGAQTGYLINSNNIELMAEKIIDLLKNPEKAKRFGKAGYKRTKEYFSLDKQVKETLKWYEKYI